MYKYGKRLTGWTEDEGVLMEFCERWSLTASLQHLTFIWRTQPSTYKRTFLYCLSEEISQALVEQRQERRQELHGMVYYFPGCGDAWNAKSVPMETRLYLCFHGSHTASEMMMVNSWWCSDMILMFRINHSVKTWGNRKKQNTIAKPEPEKGWYFCLNNDSINQLLK